MRSPTRRLIAVGLALGLVLPALGAAAATAQTNDATSVNTKDGSSVFNLTFQIKKVNDTDVDAENTAVALASCEDCQTVAGAIQVVLVTSEPESLDASNTAVAINYQCTECDTLAAAYQFVIGGGEELTFSKEGKERLHELRKEFKELEKRDDLTTEEAAAEMARIAGEVAKVVDTELVAKKDDKDDGTSTSTTTGDATTSTAGVTTTTSSEGTATTESPPTTDGTTATTTVSP